MTDDTSAKCLRCKTERLVLTTRKENFCQPCFTRWVVGKQRKVMQREKFRVNYKRDEEGAKVPRVMLALSFGVSSVVLLDIVARMLQLQAEQHAGRQGFELVAVYVDDGTGEAAAVEAATKAYPGLQVERVRAAEFWEGDMQRLCVADDFTARDISGVDKASLSSLETPETGLEGLSRSSLEDLHQIRLASLLLDAAHRHDCDTLLYGHNMSRLAVEVLSLAVKGRGAQIAAAVADGAVIHNDRAIEILHPLRDVMQLEVDHYARLEGLTPLVRGSTPVPTITKNMTIGQLTAGYFNMVEADYGSVVATVVRTADKLVPPKGHPSGACAVCLAPVHNDPKRWLQTITVNSPAGGEELRPKPAPVVGEGRPVSLCYGCTVTLGGVGEEGAAWPRHSTELVLAEYVLDE